MKNIIPLIFALTLLTLSPASASQLEWTYAFYLASGDGFFREQSSNFLEICRGAEEVTNGKIVVFIDMEPEKGKISPLRLRKGSYAFEVENCQVLKRLNIPTMGLDRNQQTDLDSSDPETLTGFFDFVEKAYPSKKKFYAITAHGDVPINPRQGAINATSIARALRNHRADVLALDMCYLGGLESLWELKDSAAHIVAAPTTIPLSVNDYAGFLQRAGAGPKSATTVAADFVAAYRQQYAGKRYPVAIFALKTGEDFEQFISTFHDRASGFSAKREQFDRVKAGKSAKSNLYGTNADLLSTLESIDQTLSKMLQPSIIAAFSTNTYFTGPALFLPVDERTYNRHRTEYRALRFCREHPDWPNFLETLYLHQ